MDWSGVDYLWIIVMFLSAVLTLILMAPIHCRASIAEHFYISPNLMKKQTHQHLGWPADEHIFGWTIPLTREGWPHISSKITHLSRCITHTHTHTHTLIHSAGHVSLLLPSVSFVPFIFFCSQSPPLLSNSASPLSFIQ